MAKLMFQFHEPRGIPTLDDVCQRFGFTRSEVDPEFGVIAVDPDAHLFVVRVDERAQQRVSGAEATDPSGETGTFSDPKIEPFGPPEKG